MKEITQKIGEWVLTKGLVLLLTGLSSMAWGLYTDLQRMRTDQRVLQEKIQASKVLIEQMRHRMDRIEGDDK